jgi:hypothetical protein
MGAKHKSVDKNDEKTPAAAEAPEDEAEAPEDETKAHKDKAKGHQDKIAEHDNDDDMDIADYINDYKEKLVDHIKEKFVKDYKYEYAKDYDGGKDDYHGVPKPDEKDSYDWIC